MREADYRPGGSTASLANPGKYIESINSNPLPLENAELRDLGAISGNQLNDVLVYTDRRIVLTAPLDGRATFVSTYPGTAAEPAIEFLPGSDPFDVRPWSEDPHELLAFATSASEPGRCHEGDAIRVQGEASLEGLIYAPAGGVEMELAGDKDLLGAVVADTIDFKGDLDLDDPRYTITAGAPIPGPRRFACSCR